MDPSDHLSVEAGALICVGQTAIQALFMRSTEEDVQSGMGSSHPNETNRAKTHRASMQPLIFT